MVLLLVHTLLLSVVGRVRSAPPLQSCADWCNKQYAPNSPGGWIDGTAVLCGGTPDHCPGALSLLANSSFFGDYGNRCVTGNKFCCCGKSANVGKTSEFLCCSEGDMACGDQRNNNNCCPQGMIRNTTGSRGCTCKGKSSTGMCASNPHLNPHPSPAPANVQSPAPAPTGSGEVSDLTTPGPNKEQTDWPLLILWGIVGLVVAVVVGYFALRFVLPCCCKCLKCFDCCDLCDVAEFMDLGAADAE